MTFRRAPGKPDLRAMTSRSVGEEDRVGQVAEGVVQVLVGLIVDRAPAPGWLARAGIAGGVDG